MPNDPTEREPMTPAARRWQTAYFAACGCVVLSVAAVLWRAEEPRPSRPQAALETFDGPAPLREPGDALPLTASLAEPRADIVPVADAPPLDRLLDTELPRATASEREVWRDVLDGLPLTDAREIVRLREKFGHGGWPGEGLAAPETGGLDLSEPPAPLPPPRFAEAADALRAAADVHRHNIANADTVGFLPLRPVLSEALSHGSGPSGVRLSGTELQTAGEPPIDSPHDADVAAPAGLFVGVLKNGELLLTPGGRVRTADGAATLRGGTVEPPAASASEPLPVYRVANPLSLEPAGNALYRPNDLSGPPQIVEDAVAEFGRRPPLLVDLRAERAALDSFLDRARLLAD